MKHVAQALLFDRNQKLLIYLRDDKPDIPFPNHWDFFRPSVIIRPLGHPRSKP